MSGFKVLSITVLGCLAGLLVGFGVSDISARQAFAQFDSVEGGTTVAAATTGSSVVGPGGNFVSQVYKAQSPTVVHVTSREIGFTFFGEQVAQESTGSGVIVDPAGYILTNAHVVANARQLVVVLSDLSQYQARLVGMDFSTDLALLKIDAEGPLTVAKFGDSNNVEEGEWVVAIGNPRGFDWTVTAGVVSAKNRSQPAFRGGPTIQGLIQTDAAINPGNSGGPLLNARGEVIGINERIITSGAGSEGIGLAIPSNTAKAVFADLKKFGKVQRSWLGVAVATEVTPALVRKGNLPVDHGVILSQVLNPSPASKAGLLPYSSDGRNSFQYDIVSSADGKSVTSQQQLLDMVRNRKPGETVKLKVYRVVNGRYSEVAVNIQLTEVPQQLEGQGYI
jgi:serine protease Do